MGGAHLLESARASVPGHRAASAASKGVPTLISTIIGAIIVGAIIGALGRLLVAGQAELSIIVTIIIGIIANVLPSPDRDGSGLLQPERHRRGSR